MTPLANNSLNGDKAFYAAFNFPLLVQPKNKCEDDGSISKIICRRSKPWNAGQIEELFEEAKAIQMRLVKKQQKERRERGENFQ